MDQTDKKLVNGLIVGAVVLGVVYFWPWEWPIMGYSNQAQLRNSAVDSLRQTAIKYNPNYAPMQEVHFGVPNSEAPGDQGGVALLSDLKRLYNDANNVTGEYIKVKQASNRIKFPDWTNIPPEHEKSPGTYFIALFERHKVLVDIECKKSGVQLDDPQIGFGKLAGGVASEARAKELLREMFIAEKIIELCINAKLKEEQRERDMKKKPEAYMRVMQVEPQVSEPTGPTALVPNPKYDPTEKNPASPKFKKYTIDKWATFIQEYPVKIQLICDTNSFIHFLHSIRTIEGQFLVIRQLEILSPALDVSNRDKSELEPFKADASTTANALKKWPDQPEQIIVTMTAAGMDFFDPKEYPKGLYEKKASDDKPQRKGGRSLARQAPSAAPSGGQ